MPPHMGIVIDLNLKKFPDFQIVFLPKCKNKPVYFAFSKGSHIFPVFTKNGYVYLPRSGASIICPKSPFKQNFFPTSQSWYIFDNTLTITILSINQPKKKEIA